jgi:hypothetical protein
MSRLLHDGLSDLAVDIAPAGFAALWDGRAVAIHAGDTASLARLLEQHPELATAALGTGDHAPRPGMTRTLLHVVSDWPGHFPNGPAVVNVIVRAGADANARFAGLHHETPLHWAASSDDVAPSTPCSTPARTSRPEGP